MIKRYIKAIGRNIGILMKHLPESPLKNLQNRYIYQPRIKDLGIDIDRTPIFNSIFFEVRTKCNGRCSFCAASAQNDIREDKKMPIALYKKVIGEL